MNVEQEAWAMEATTENESAPPRRRMRTASIAALAGLLLLAAGTVVATTGDDDRGVANEANAAQATRGTVGAAGFASQGSGGRSGELASPSDAASFPVVPPDGGKTVDPAGPRIVRTAELAIGVEDGRFAAAFDRVASIAASHGGFVVSSSTVTEDGRKRSADSRPAAGDVTLRVAAERFDAARLALADLGKVERQSLRGEDVGGQLVDYEARLRSLEAQEESLRTLLARAGGVAEVLQVQNALFEVRQQVEQLTAQRDQLSQAAALATITVSLFEPGAAFSPDPEPANSLADSVERAVDGAVSVVGGMIVVLGWVTPVAVLALLAWAGLRLRRRPAPPAVPASATP